MKTTHTTLTRAARIAAALAADNETTTEQARVYLTNLIECIGEGETFADKLEDFAAIENHRDDAFGVNVMEDVDGDPYITLRAHCGCLCKTLCRSQDDSLSERCPG